MNEKSAKIMSIPASREPLTLLSVDRAVSELRRGRPVAVQGGGGAAVLALAAEAVTPEALADLRKTAAGVPSLAISAARAAVLGLAPAVGKVATVTADDGLTAELVLAVADPLAGVAADFTGVGLHAAIKEDPAYDCESASVTLTKIARLLPAAVTTMIGDPDAEDLARWCARRDILWVDAGDVFQYESAAARSLRIVSQARVPIEDAVDTRVVAFRPFDGGLEHLAIVIGEPPPDRPVLTRIHSECFTGDLLGSLRCDCGDQLQGAMAEIKAAGKGILLYLAQEGRGIGLVNKLRAYELQDRGFDTMDANEQLGFDADERIYLPAVQMLRQLGYASVRLMTNNPEKVGAMARLGIEVNERVQHAFPSNKHNEFYLRTKAAKGGHVL